MRSAARPHAAQPAALMADCRLVQACAGLGCAGICYEVSRSPSCCPACSPSRFPEILEFWSDVYAATRFLHIPLIMLQEYHSMEEKAPSCCQTQRPHGIWLHAWGPRGYEGPAFSTMRAPGAFPPFFVHPHYEGRPHNFVRPHYEGASPFLLGRRPPMGRLSWCWAMRARCFAACPRPHDEGTLGGRGMALWGRPHGALWPLENHKRL